MAFTFTISTVIKASAKTIYNAWLSSSEHNKMTDGESAVASKKIGGAFKAHGDYIFGKNVELIPDKKIVQSWRTVEFKDTEPDSVLEIRFEEESGKTLVTLIHSNVPEKKYKQGWVDYYFTPMKEYFESKSNKPPAK